MEGRSLNHELDLLMLRTLGDPARDPYVMLFGSSKTSYTNLALQDDPAKVWFSHSKDHVIPCDPHFIMSYDMCVCVSFLYACPWLRKARKRTHNVDWCVKGWLAWKRTVMANTRICTSDWGLRLQMWNHVIIHVVYTCIYSSVSCCFSIYVLL